MSIANIMDVSTGKIASRFIPTMPPLPVPTPALFGTSGYIVMDPNPAGNSGKSLGFKSVSGPTTGNYIPLFDLDIQNLIDTGYNYMKIDISLSINEGTVYRAADAIQTCSGLYINPFTYSITNSTTISDPVPYAIKGTPPPLSQVTDPTTNILEFLSSCVFMPLIFKQAPNSSQDVSVCGSVSFTDYISMTNLLAVNATGINIGFRVQPSDTTAFFNVHSKLYFTACFEPVAF